MKKDICQCGGQKDTRAKMCLSCKNAPKTHKICHGCLTTYPIEEFNLTMRKGKKARKSRCKKCIATYDKWRKENKKDQIKASSKAYAIKNPHKIRLWGFRAKWKKMGFNPDDVINFKNRNCSKCCICDVAEKLVLDHDHNSGTLRGVLCSECNLGLGKFKDNISLLQSAVSYLQKIPPS